MALAHYPEDLDVAELTSGYPSETGVVDAEDVMKLMGQVRPYADRVLAVADLEQHLASMTGPEDADEAELEFRDNAATHLFAFASAKNLMTFPIPKYTVRVLRGDDSGGADDAEASSSK
jgi:hypothetical protein